MALTASPLLGRRPMMGVVLPRKQETKCELASSLTESITFTHKGEITMRQTAGILVILMMGVIAAQLFADVSVVNKGLWPESWPKELEPLREKSRTIEGPLGGFLHYEIPFTDRDAFESAWSHLLKVRSPESRIVLIRSPYEGTGARKGSSMKAGVLINSYPFAGSTADAPAKDSAPKTTSTTTVVLVVDGEVVNLNRIPLPSNTYIEDHRFNDSGITNR
jgi:hypothetical protein